MNCSFKSVEKKKYIAEESSLPSVYQPIIIEKKITYMEECFNQTDLIPH